MNVEDIEKPILAWRPNGERFIDFRGAPYASSGMKRFFKTPAMRGSIRFAFFAAAGTLLELALKASETKKIETEMVALAISQAIVPVAHYTLWKFFDRNAPAKDMVIDTSGLATPDVSRLATRKMRKYFFDAAFYGMGAAAAGFLYPGWAGVAKDLANLSPAETIGLYSGFNLAFNAFFNTGWCAFASLQLKNRRWNVVERPGSNRVSMPSTDMLPKPSAP